MNFAKRCFLTATSFGLLFFSQVQAAVITVPGDYATISLAITAAASGDVINVADGVYNENLVIDKSLSLIGNSEAGVIINVPATNVQGIVVNAGVNNVTIQNFTINRPLPFDTNPLICTNCFGIKFAVNTGVSVDSVTINDSVKTGLILDGVDTANITNITANNSISGNGISVTDSSNVNLSNLTTIGNAGSDLGFYTKVGSLLNVVLSGTNNFGGTPLVTYVKLNGADIMDVDVTNDFSHEVYGTWIAGAALLPFSPGNTAGNTVRGIYTETLDDALAGAPFLERVLGDAAGDGDDLTPLAIPALLAGLLAAPDPNAYLDLNLPSSDRIISPVILHALDNSITVPDEDQVVALGYQAAAPQFNSLTVTAQDSGGAAKTAVLGTFYVGIGEKIHFNLELNPADSVGTGNSFVPFNIGATSVQTANLISSATPVTNRTRTYNVNLGENGLVGITGVTFFDAVGLSIENLPGVFPATNIVVDTIAPSILSVTQVGSGSWARFVKEGETVAYNITYSEPVTVSAVNTASTANNATGAATEVSAVSSATDTLIVTVQAGDNGIITPTVNFDITDIAGNTTTITSLGTITGGGSGNIIEADTTLPTLTSVSISSDNLNSDWAKTGDTITLSFTADENLRNGNVAVMILGQVATVTPGCGFGTCTSYTAAITTNGTEPEGVAAFTIDFLDQAANAGLQVTATTDATVVTFDKTAPTLPLVSIISNNALNTALAKSNDTITVTYTVADNLATSGTISGSPTILSSPAVSSGVVIGAGNTISRFTDGSETSEVVAPFSFAVQDQAGNISATTTATTDGSEVKFDRTDPIVTNVEIAATSADLSAFMGDVPTYYAKQGDTLDFVLQICDYVDSDTNPPTGTVFGAAATFVDQGLVGAPGNCTTGAGNLSQFREWKVTMAGIDGTEGVISFSVDGKDNAGNTLVPSITVTTNGSSVIFDKTAPTVPTDMVDLGGAATAGYKPAPKAALYTWTNDADPAGGAPVSSIQKFDIRYNNPNTGINEMVTITEPALVRSFSPTSMIPDLAAYTVNMNVHDKAGNPSSEQVVYTQKYGIEVTGTVVDAETGAPIEGAIVAVIAPAGSTCNLPGQEVCTAGTDAAGKYSITVAPNTQYKLDVTKIARYYIAKSDLTITTTDVVSNVSLQAVAEGEIQTGNQGTVITTNAEFSLNGIEQTTYITAFSQSGEITTTVTPAGLQITSFGTITGITSNNPNVVIEDQGNNVFLVKNAGNILNTSDNQNRGSSVSSSYASGSNRVGIRSAQGGASAGFQAGMSRGDRAVNGGVWTEEESMAFAQKLNQGTGYKVMQYRNRNGYMVFAGYQTGRMALSDMTGSNPALMLSKQVVYRGPRRGTEQTFRNITIADRKEIVHRLFSSENESTEQKVLVAEEGNQQKAARPIVETKKTAFAYNNPEIAGFGRPESVYPGVINKKENDARYVNKFARVNTPATIAPSRLQGKNVNMIVFRANNKRSSKKLVLGQLFNQHPELVTGRTRVVRR